MRPLLAAIAALGLLAGCTSGQTACEGYVEAYNGCIEEIGSGYLVDDVVCEQASDENADYYDCLADAYSNDCSTNENYTIAVESAAVCAFPTDTE